MNKPTPGPWQKVKTLGYFRIYGPDYGEPGCQSIGAIDIEDNADLTAAAPELLDALKGCVELMDRKFGNSGAMPEAWVIARAAISKAQGTTVPA